MNTYKNVKRAQRFIVFMVVGITIVITICVLIGYMEVVSHWEYGRIFA